MVLSQVKPAIIKNTSHEGCLAREPIKATPKQSKKAIELVRSRVIWLAARLVCWAQSKKSHAIAKPKMLVMCQVKRSVGKRDCSSLLGVVWIWRANGRKIKRSPITLWATAISTVRNPATIKELFID